MQYDGILKIFLVQLALKLCIVGATEQDSAVYTCQLKTSSGQTSASASVTVLPKEIHMKSLLDPNKNPILTNI